tara:strand:- start:2164 stop:2352 length:189 start_codon:yes stop_codon:yes gene_type:complete
MKPRHQKRKEAEARADNTAALSPKERLRILDSKFGKNEGAMKERARLKKQILLEKTGEKKKK